jgi:hypothetical protein
MKKSFFATVLLVFASMAIAQTPVHHPEGKSDLDTLTLEVELNRSEYLPFEPIAANSSFRTGPGGNWLSFHRIISFISRRLPSLTTVVQKKK